MASSSPDLKRDPELEHPPDELAELRALIVGEQIVELQKLRQRLDDPDLRADETSQILGRAIALSLRRDRTLQNTFYPVVANALQTAVDRNPKLLATSLAPIIGETVRKSVANAFRDMVDNLNLTLERSLSLESMKWRFEALRTGKTFGEIALARSLRYKVQQVFLIHRETGTVLQYVSSPGEGVNEAEVVSSMVTALQDFARDAFASKQDLDTVRLGELIIWVHYGPRTLLAGTIVGTPPPELRNVLQHENELIQQEFAEQLATFKGDASAFEAARPHLQKCLLGQTAKPQKQSRWMVAAVAAVIVLALLSAGWILHQRNAHWDHYLAQLNNEPGIVVTGAERNWGHYWVWGLRDPMAPDPVTLAAAAGVPAKQLDAHFLSIQSIDERFRLRREFETEKERLEEQMVLFPVNSSVLSSDQSLRIDNIEDSLIKLQETADKMGRTIHVTLNGRADKTGKENKNEELSTDRARRVYDALLNRGIPEAMMRAVGLGDSEPIRHGSEAYQLEVNRSVTLKVQTQLKGER